MMLPLTAKFGTINWAEVERELQYSGLMRLFPVYQTI
jgi:hypothetical protein